MKARSRPAVPVLAIPGRRGICYVPLDLIQTGLPRTWGPEGLLVASLWLGTTSGRPLELIAPAGYLDELSFRAHAATGGWSRGCRSGAFPAAATTPP